jgi:DNA-directed RNA polymerase subunit E'/Rpb7
MSMDSYCVRSLLRDPVLVKPHMIGSNYREVVLHLLSKRLDGVCSRHGYIVPGSISVHKINNAKVQAFSLNGDVCYLVQFYASVCNPPIGAVLTARVVNMNKFGIMTHSGITAEDGTFKPVIESIVTRQPAGSTSAMGSDVDLDTLKIGDTVFVEILGKKFELNDEKISVIGRIVSSAKERIGKRVAKTHPLSDVLVREEYEEDQDEIGAEFDEEDVGSEEDDERVRTKKNRKKKNGEDDGDEDEDEDEDDGDGDDERESDEEDDEEEEEEEDEDASDDSDDEELSDGDDEDEEDDDTKKPKKSADKAPIGRKAGKQTAKKADKIPVPPAKKVKGGSEDAASEFFDDVFDDDDFGGGSDEEFGGDGGGRRDEDY